MEQIKKADFKDMAPNLFCKTSSSLAGDYSQALAGISQTQQRPANTHTHAALAQTRLSFSQISFRRHYHTVFHFYLQPVLIMGDTLTSLQRLL